jgi:hypothetical protein
MPNDNDLIHRLPPARDVAREIYTTARRARRLRTLYQLIQRIESEENDESAGNNPSKEFTEAKQ